MKLPGLSLIYCDRPDVIGKFSGVAKHSPAGWNGTLLDVGCRNSALREVLPRRKATYTGLDIAPPCDVAASVDRGLPFGEAAFDVVVCLDVLEHTEDPHQGFVELCRVAGKELVVSLPNCYEIRSRVGFLLGSHPSGKYGLPPDPPGDRHRWIFPLGEAREFIASNAEANGWSVVNEGVLVGPRRRRLLPNWLISYSPELFAPTYVAYLHPG